MGKSNIRYYCKNLMKRSVYTTDFFVFERKEKNMRKYESVVLINPKLGEKKIKDTMSVGTEKIDR